jgi:hypothetical protein
MVKEEVLRLIKGRIEDEYHKHPLLDWSAIAANKIYSQWFEYLNNENQDLQNKISQLEKDVEYWQGEFYHWHQQAIQMADKKSK